MIFILLLISLLWLFRRSNMLAVQIVILQQQVTDLKGSFMYPPEYSAKKEYEAEGSVYPAPAMITSGIF